MFWPKPTDYHEAVQNPRVSFRDPELRVAHAVLNPLGLPMPRSGNFADVYELRCSTTDRSWAVKCFTREVPGLKDRYAAISQQLELARLPFIVDLKFLSDGICVCGRWFPVVKMRWIEGLALNEFLAAHVDRRPVMQSLAALWLRLAQELRDAGIAHGDLQHGNVLLVASRNAESLAVRLIDYDGMAVPALAKDRSGELGHANYQHPERIRDGLYGFEMDRFPHLVIYTALRALAIGGQDLWRRFDTGDNLLFRQSDFSAPGSSSVFQALWDMGDPEVRGLVGRLLVATGQPYDRVPLLSELVGAAGVRALTAAELGHVQNLLTSSRALPKAVPIEAPRLVDSKEPWWKGSELPDPAALPSRPSVPPGTETEVPTSDKAEKTRTNRKRARVSQGHARSNLPLYLGLAALAFGSAMVTLAVAVLGDGAVPDSSATVADARLPETKPTPPRPELPGSSSAVSSPDEAFPVPTPPAELLPGVLPPNVGRPGLPIRPGGASIDSEGGTGPTASELPNPTGPNSPPSATSTAPGTPSSGVQGRSKFSFTRRLGGSGGAEFENLPMQPVVYLSGFAVTTRDAGGASIIQSLRPIYTTATGVILIDPVVYGRATGKEVPLWRSGYVVGGLNVRWSNKVEGLGLILMPVKEGKLDTSAQLELTWIGGKGGTGPELLGGDGTPIVGIFGRHNTDLDAIGLIQFRPDPITPATKSP